MGLAPRCLRGTGGDKRPAPRRRTFRSTIMILKSLVLFLVASFLSLTAVASCDHCGVVSEVRKVKIAGKGTGLGAVAGGVAGGLLGHQIGSGTGNTVATIAGAAGGAYAGHQVEKKVKEKREYRVVVKLDNGQTREVGYKEKPAFAAGDRVSLEQGTLQRLSK